MGAQVECQSCGATVTRAFARVFGSETNDVYACPACTSSGDLGRCAATAPDADGTLRVHRPGQSEPQPATVSQDADEDDAQREPLTLPELSTQSTSDATDETSSGDRSDFEALAAE